MKVFFRGKTCHKVRKIDTCTRNLALSILVANVRKKILQLAQYCFLIRKNTEKRNFSLALDYTNKLFYKPCIGTLDIMFKTKFYESWTYELYISIFLILLLTKSYIHILSHISNISRHVVFGFSHQLQRYNLEILQKWS